METNLIALAPGVQRPARAGMLGLGRGGQAYGRSAVRRGEVLKGASRQ
jgi:hypothetical protein